MNTRNTPTRSSANEIRFVHARRVWDSRGCPTIEVELRLHDGAMGRAIAPAGISKGRHESVVQRDGGKHFGGLDVQRAVAQVNGEIARAVLGLAADDQLALDERLIELDGTPDMAHLGANATLAVSLAAAQAAAASRGVPLYQYLGGPDATLLPLPMVQIFGGGVHTGRRVDLQSLMIVCPGAACFSQALEWSAEVYRNAGQLMHARGAMFGVADEGGWWPVFNSNEQALEVLVAAIERAGFVPGQQVALALDVSAGGFGRSGRYLLGLEKRAFDSDGWIEQLQRWTEKFPILSLEDPLADDDAEGLARLTRALGTKLQIVADDLVASSAARLRQLAATGAANAVLLKPDQRGTLSETLQACTAARSLGYAAIASARSGESEDLAIVHLAVGWQLGQIKLGAFARGERTAKWNELLRIEERLGARARYAGAAALGRSARGRG